MPDAAAQEPKVVNVREGGPRRTGVAKQTFGAGGPRSCSVRARISVGVISVGRLTWGVIPGASKRDDAATVVST